MGPTKDDNSTQNDMYNLRSTKKKQEESGEQADALPNISSEVDDAQPPKPINLGAIPKRPTTSTYETPKTDRSRTNQPGNIDFNFIRRQHHQSGPNNFPDNLGAYAHCFNIPPPRYRQREYENEPCSENLVNLISNIVDKSVKNAFQNHCTLGDRNNTPNDTVHPNRNHAYNIQAGLNNIPSQFSNLNLNASLFSLGDFSKLLPDFDGESGLQAPEFLNFLENGVAVDTISFCNLKILFRNCFKNSAKLWWEAYSDYFRDYVQFKTEFLSHFWSKRKQIKIKDQLERTEYREGLLVDHFNYWVAATKYLEPPYTVKELIDAIAPHFPPNISCSLLGCSSLSDAVSRLRQADEYLKNKPVSHPIIPKRFYSNQRDDNQKPNTYTNKVRFPERNQNVKSINALGDENFQSDSQGNEVAPHL